MGAGLPGGTGGGDRGRLPGLHHPGILVMTVASVAHSTAIAVAMDMTERDHRPVPDDAHRPGLGAHRARARRGGADPASPCRSSLAFALLLGYRSDAGVAGWLVAAGAAPCCWRSR